MTICRHTNRFSSTLVDTTGHDCSYFLFTKEIASVWPSGQFCFKILFNFCHVQIHILSECLCAFMFTRLPYASRSYVLYGGGGVQYNMKPQTPTVTYSTRTSHPVAQCVGGHAPVHNACYNCSRCPSELLQTELCGKASCSLFLGRFLRLRAYRTTGCPGLILHGFKKRPYNYNYNLAQ